MIRRVPSDEIAEAQTQLGVSLPATLRAVYESGDGRFRDDGQWLVVWPLDRLVQENAGAWREGRLPRSMLAFGDDGTGNPFCVVLDEELDEVLRWSWIDADVESSVGSMADFLQKWVLRVRFPCPCCGFLTHDEEPGDFEYCVVCGWQDDLSQLRFAAMGGGANRLSLKQAQTAFLSQSLPAVASKYQRDPGWRPLDPAVDRIEVPERGREYGMTYADDRTEYYYWRSASR
jgi:hypothetical protein